MLCHVSRQKQNFFRRFISLKYADNGNEENNTLFDPLRHQTAQTLTLKTIKTCICFARLPRF